MQQGGGELIIDDALILGFHELFVKNSDSIIIDCYHFVNLQCYFSNYFVPLCCCIILLCAGGSSLMAYRHKFESVFNTCTCFMISYFRLQDLYQSYCSEKPFLVPINSSISKIVSQGTF